MAGTNPFSSRTARRAILAAALFVFAVGAAPLLAIMAACAMPCCDTAPGAQMMAAGCAEQCGIRSDSRPPQPLVEVVAAAPPSPLLLAPLALPATLDGPLAPPSPALPADAAERRHAVPGDPLLYLSNSAFLI